MAFDPTITFGAVLNFAGVVGIGLIYLIRMEGKINVFTVRIDRLEKTVEALAKNDSRMAVIEERLNNHSKMLTTAQSDISDLRRGNGFITTHRERVDGEYP
jgi:hypothetical protein